MSAKKVVLKRTTTFVVKVEIGQERKGRDDDVNGKNDCWVDGNDGTSDDNKHGDTSSCSGSENEVVRKNGKNLYMVAVGLCTYQSARSASVYIKTPVDERVPSVVLFNRQRRRGLLCTPNLPMRG